jgi:bacterioferritin-associated ferredoxin
LSVVESSRPRLCIDRCVCRRTRFEDLLPLAREHGWDLEELSRVTGCGLQCGLCRPYLRRMLIDGTTVFDTVLLDEEETT